MGVDTKLYLNTRWSLRDIRQVIERTQNTKVEVKSNHEIDEGYFIFLFKDRMLHVFTHTQTPLGAATSLSFASNDDGHQILKAIADVFGGAFMDNDVDGNIEFINGGMYEEDALPYFLKSAIMNGVDPDDIKALDTFVEEWHKKHKA